MLILETGSKAKPKKEERRKQSLYLLPMREKDPVHINTKHKLDGIGPFMLGSKRLCSSADGHLHTARVGSRRKRRALRLHCRPDRCNQPGQATETMPSSAVVAWV